LFARKRPSQIPCATTRAMELVISCTFVPLKHDHPFERSPQLSCNSPIINRRGWDYPRWASPPPCALPRGAVELKFSPHRAVTTPTSSRLGEGGIRTHESLTAPAVFKTAAFNHSATSPNSWILRPFWTRGLSFSGSADEELFKQNTLMAGPLGRLLPIGLAIAGNLPAPTCRSEHSLYGSRTKR
jgi:hypothetical protein